LVYLWSEGFLCILFCVSHRMAQSYAVVNVSESLGPNAMPWSAHNEIIIMRYLVLLDDVFLFQVAAALVLNYSTFE